MKCFNWKTSLSAYLFELFTGTTATAKEVDCNGLLNIAHNDW